MFFFPNQKKRWWKIAAGSWYRRSVKCPIDQNGWKKKKVFGQNMDKKKATFGEFFQSNWWSKIVQMAMGGRGRKRERGIKDLPWLQ